MKKLISGPGFNHLIEGRHGYVLEWSPEETALFAQFCGPGHCVVDSAHPPGLARRSTT